jgi:membrane-bound lytic murein transglycosylase B
MPLTALALALLAGGCKPKSNEAPPVAETPAVSESAPAVEADLSPLLAELTQAVRKYGFEKQKVPASLEELVAAGYLSAKPAAPAGKKFSIDPKTMQVVVVSN